MANRKQRRAQLKEVKKAKKKNPAADVATDERHILAQQLQEELHKTIHRCIKDKTAPDLPTVVQSLSITAATFAIQCGVTESQWRRAQAVYMRQVREQLGLEVFTDNPGFDPEEGPKKIILPS